MMIGVLVLLVFLAAVAAILMRLQTRLAFPFIPVSAQIPDAVKKAGGEVIWLDADGARVEAWFLPARQPGAAPLVLNTHSNGELIDQWAARVAPLREAGVGVLLVEYPGYGRSEGRPSEAGDRMSGYAAADGAHTCTRHAVRGGSSAG